VPNESFDSLRSLRVTALTATAKYEYEERRTIHLGLVLSRAFTASSLPISSDADIAAGDQTQVGR
jgi:hypothetical protein